MTLRNTHERYGSVSKFFHWFIFILITLQLVVGFSMDKIGNRFIQGNFYTLHESVGLLILFSMIFFILWSLINPKPLWPDSMRRWERIAANFVRISFYILLLVMPLSGWIMTTASGHPPKFFWIVSLPMLGIAKSKSLDDIALGVHNIIVWFILVLLLIHILAALRHHFILKDTILRRILPNRFQK